MNRREFFRQCKRYLQAGAVLAIAGPSVAAIAQPPEEEVLPEILAEVDEINVGFEPDMLVTVGDQLTGKNIYVSQAKCASDRNDGSFQHPVRTLARAQELAAQGSTIMIEPGTYTEVLHDIRPSITI